MVLGVAQWHSEGESIVGYFISMSLKEDMVKFPEYIGWESSLVKNKKIA